MLTKVEQDIGVDTASRNLLKRNASPEDMGNLALFLVSSDSWFATCSDFLVDGGIINSFPSF